MKRDPKSSEPDAKPSTQGAAAPAPAVEPYEPPKLLKFEKLEKLIVSGE